MGSVRGGAEAPPFGLLTNKMKSVPPVWEAGWGGFQRGDGVT